MNMEHLTAKAATALGLPSETLREMGFNREADKKAGKERAEKFLDEQIAALLMQAMKSEHPDRSMVQFELPDSMSVHSYDLQESFSRRANAKDETGMAPIKLLGNLQLKMYSITRDIRANGYYSCRTIWTLTFEQFDPQQPTQPKSL